ncbi:uncharacterized protein V6R79_010119 [Siganus canaliculatus]
MPIPVPVPTVPSLPPEGSSKLQQQRQDSNQYQQLGQNHDQQQLIRNQLQL